MWVSSSDGRACRGGGWIGLDHLAHHKPVEQHADRGQVLLDQGCSTLLDGLTESALQHRVREVKRLLRNGIRESGNL